MGYVSSPSLALALACCIKRPLPWRLISARSMSKKVLWLHRVCPVRRSHCNSSPYRYTRPVAAAIRTLAPMYASAARRQRGKEPMPIRHTDDRIDHCFCPSIRVALIPLSIVISFVRRSPSPGSAVCRCVHLSSSSRFSTASFGFEAGSDLGVTNQKSVQYYNLEHHF